MKYLITVLNRIVNEERKKVVRAREYATWFRSEETKALREVEKKLTSDRSLSVL